uniref:Reverse transcriptase Ty1/copia-type domain-containing protein n=1 Tax=Solanum lycopersicum TaxID=4081 RepID=A0A3Q7GH39_SOLLC
MVDTITIIQLPQEQEDVFLTSRIMDIEIRGIEMEELVTLQQSLNSTVNFVIIKGVSMFTQEQYYEILQMLRKGKSKEVDTMANVATAGVSGTSCNFTALISDMSHINWIIDTGASNHMVQNFGLMSQSTNLDVQGGMRVNLPTGDQVSISHIGESLVLKDKVLGLAGCKPSSTPLEFNHKLTSAVFDEFIGKNANVEDLLLDDFGKYQRLIGKLLYLTMTRPDIAFVVQVLSQYMHSPKSSHMEAALRVVRYIKGTAETRRLVTGYMIKLGGALVSWKSNKQSTVSRSSAEAEFRSMATTVAEIVWLKGLFRELGMNIKLPDSGEY